MSSLECYSSIFTGNELLQKLRNRHILTIMDFIREPPDQINKITNLRFGDILEMKEKLMQLYKGNFHSGLELHLKRVNRGRTLYCGIPAIEELMSKLESSVFYELCGLSGSGKTQICSIISADLALNGNKVYYIDTKNEFNVDEICVRISQKTDSKEDTVACLSRITVIKVNDLYQLMNALHQLKIHLAYDSTPLIVIDCISTLYFLAVNQEDKIGLGLLNHIVSVIKFLKTEFQVIFILTNLAIKYAARTEKASDNMILKPCLGSYWSQVCDSRITIRKIINLANVIAMETEDRSINLDLDSLY